MCMPYSCFSSSITNTLSTDARFSTVPSTLSTNSWYALHNLGEFGGDVAVQLPHLDVAEHHKALVEFGGVEHGDIFLDIATAFHAFQPLKHRGRRQVDLLREFLDCQSGVALQRA